MARMEGFGLALAAVSNKSIASSIVRASNRHRSITRLCNSGFPPRVFLLGVVSREDDAAFLLGDGGMMTRSSVRKAAASLAEEERGKEASNEEVLRIPVSLSTERKNYADLPGVCDFVLSI